MKKALIIFFVFVVVGCSCSNDKKDTKLSQIQQQKNMKCNAESIADVVKSTKGIVVRNGVAFVNDQASFFVQQKSGKLFLEKTNIEKSKDDLVKSARLLFNENNELYVFDVFRDNPQMILQTSRRKFCYKVSNNKMFLSGIDGSWQLRMRFIKVLEEDKQNTNPQYPCSLVYLETKWFKGEYEIYCEK